MAKAVTSRIRPSLADANARAPEALLYPPHPVGLEDGVDRLMRRRRDGVLATEGDDLAGEPIEFEAVARLEIVRHGRPHRGRKACHPTIELRCKVRRKLDAGRATDRNRLVHQLVEERPQVLVVTDDAEGLARARRDAGGTRKQHELLPDVAEHMIRQRDLDVRSLHLLHVIGEHGIGTSVETAAADFGPCAGVADDPRLRDRRDDIGRPADRDVIAEDRGETLDAVDAILKRHHAGVGTYERTRLLAGPLGIPELDGEQHHVDGSDLLWIVGDVEVLEMKVAKRALYAQTIAANGIAMRATRNEGHVVSGRGHAPAEITSDGARRHDRHPHAAPSAAKVFAPASPPSTARGAAGWFDQW